MAFLPFPFCLFSHLLILSWGIYLSFSYPQFTRSLDREYSGDHRLHCSPHHAYMYTFPLLSLRNLHVLFSPPLPSFSLSSLLARVGIQSGAPSGDLLLFLQHQTQHSQVLNPTFLEHIFTVCIFVVLNNIFLENAHSFPEDSYSAAL